MKNTKIIGRIEECQRLEECLEEERAQLIVVYGRRRVGKTFLINEFFDNNFTFKLTGAYNQTKSVQLRNFIGELNRKTKKKYSQPIDWVEAFELLREYLSSLSKQDKQVVFFDEMPWMDTPKAGFLEAFEWFWNDFGCTMENLVFVVCGSANSWMVDNIDKNKGGLFNRQTCRLFLKPFNLKEVKEYLESRGFKWSLYDIAECYMILGGIPFYLSLLKRKLSLSQNIDYLFFREKGELWDEFSNLYATLFSNTDTYIKIVEALSKNRNGLTRNGIIAKTKLPSNGNLTKMLGNLADSGFVRISQTYGKKKKDLVYQLADYYTSFYFHFVKEGYGQDENYWTNSLDNSRRKIWEGLTYEQLCKDHIRQIKTKLGIAGVLSEESSWSCTADEELGINGAQIDLIIKRRDRVINICEIKFSNDEYLIDKNYDKSLRNKISAFVKTNNEKYSIQLTMITTYGIKKNMYSSLVNNEVVLEDLFY